jgi:hypothetical protein
MAGPDGKLDSVSIKRSRASATAIDNSTDTRFVTIFGGQLYVSRDSTQSATAGTDIGSYGQALPTSRTPQSVRRRLLPVFAGLRLRYRAKG